MPFTKGHTINVGIKRSKKVCKILSESKMGDKNPNWKNGRRKHMSGYVFILSKSHPFCNAKGYVFEHRLVLEKYLKRYLNAKETTHHINGIKNDNRVENLMLFINHSAHTTYHNNKELCLKKWIVFDGRKLCQK